MDSDGLLRLGAGIVGIFLVVRALLSAVRTFILPRGSNDAVARFVFVSLLRLFSLVAPARRPYGVRDRVFAYFGPVGVILVAVVWLILIMLGYTLIFWASGAPTLAAAARASGSSLLTLGFVTPSSGLHAALAFSEATMGLGLAGLLVAYLPTIHGAFARRELAVNLLEVRADAPPSAVAMLARFQRLGNWEALHDEWQRWEHWFAELEESHTSLSVLAFYRSPRPTSSWITAAGAVMDAAALSRSLLDIPRDVQADLAIRAGFVALRAIADFFGIDYDPAPRPTDPTSITRLMFDVAAAELTAAGMPLRADRDQAYRDFNGWRVNYDRQLLAISQLVMAPNARWNTAAERATIGRVRFDMGSTSR